MSATVADGSGTGSGAGAHRVSMSGPGAQLPAGRPSMPELGRGQLRVLLVLMATALALVVGAASSLAVAQPDVGLALGATQTQLTWVVNGYALAFAALLLPAGIATDKYGRRVALVVGLLVFGAASIASGWAGDATGLIVLRLVAGIGATLVMPATLSVLVDAFPQERRAFAVAVWAGVTGAGALLGVLLAGILLHYFWWGSIQVAYGVAAFVLVPIVALVVANHRNAALSLDPRGAVLAAVGLGALVYGVIQGPDQGWTDRLTLAGLVAGGVLLTLFVVAELRAEHPMLDVRLFRSRGLTAGSLLVLLLSLAVFGFFLLGPQFLQVVRGYDSLGAALRLLPFALGIGPASQLSPMLTAKLGARWTGSLGAGTMAAGLALFAWSAQRDYWQFAVALVVTAAGMGLALTAGTGLIIDGLPADRRTLASAVNDVTREVGGALGAAVMGSVLVSLYQDRVAGALTHLPGPLAEQAREGITGALLAGQHLGPQAPALIAAARDSFTHGFQGAMVLGAGVLLVTAVVTGLLAPGRDAPAPGPTGDDQAAVGRRRNPGVHRTETTEARSV